MATAPFNFGKLMGAVGAKPEGAVPTILNKTGGGSSKNPNPAGLASKNAAIGRRMASNKGKPPSAKGGLITESKGLNTPDTNKPF